MKTAMRIKKMAMIGIAVITLGTNTMASGDFNVDNFIKELKASTTDPQILLFINQHDNDLLDPSLSTREFALDRLRDNLSDYFRDSDPIKDKLKEHLEKEFGPGFGIDPELDPGIGPIDPGNPNNGIGIEDPIGPIEDDVNVGHRVREIKAGTIEEKVDAVNKAFEKAGFNAKVEEISENRYKIEYISPKTGKIKKIELKGQELEDIKSALKKSIKNDDSGNREERRSIRQTDMKDRANDRQSNRAADKADREGMSKEERRVDRQSDRQGRTDSDGSRGGNKESRRS